MLNARQRKDELHNVFFVICTQLPKEKLAGDYNMILCYIHVVNAGKNMGHICPTGRSRVKAYYYIIHGGMVAQDDGTSWSLPDRT